MSTHRFILFLFSVVTSIPLFAQVKVACIGNSVTYGYGIENRETNSYPAQLQQLLGSEYEVQNFGKSGSTLLRKGHRPYNEQDEYQAALQYKPDIAVIHLGLNDTDPRNWPDYQENFIPDYLQLIQDIKASNPKVRVLICRLSPITDKHSRFKSGTRDWYWQIQQQIEQIAATQKLQLIDLQEILYNRPELLPDAIHPNAEGASLIAKRVYSSITGDFGGLALPLTFSDNMVLQRDMPLTLSGTADNGTKVSIEIAGKKAKTTTADNGKWTLTLPPLQAGGPYILEVKADKETRSLQNVMVGEVWLCSGQSNMAWLLKQSKGGKEAIEQANNPNIRLLNMQPRWQTYDVEWPKATMDSLNRLQYYSNNGWQETTPATAADFSAIA
ncbi:MAG: GDSL-type esterase/lipase family protein, partial [Tannerellaceae bacterium]